VGHFGGPRFLFLKKRVGYCRIKMNMTENKVYIEKAAHKERGKVYPEDQAKISVFDVGLQRAIGVFETLRTYNGKLFKLDEHLNRLLQSANKLGLEHSWSKPELEERAITTLNKTDFEEATMRITITGGKDQGLMEPENPTLIIAVSDLHEYPESFYKEGVKVVTYEGKRTFPDIKTLNYLKGFEAVKKARQKNAHEAIYCQNDKVLEGTTSNIFAVKEDIIVTPDKDILEGITRDFVIQMVKEMNYRVEKRELPLPALLSSDEVFLTSTHREILPVVQIDKNQISEGQPGDITQELLEQFRVEVRR